MWEVVELDNQTRQGAFQNNTNCNLDSAWVWIFDGRKTFIGKSVDGVDELVRKDGLTGQNITHELID